MNTGLVFRCPYYRTAVHVTCYIHYQCYPYYRHSHNNHHNNHYYGHHNRGTRTHYIRKDFMYVKNCDLFVIFRYVWMLISGEQTIYDTFLYMFMISLPHIYMRISYDSLIVAIRLLGTVVVTLFSVIKKVFFFQTSWCFQSFIKVIHFRALCQISLAYASD